ncbi:hypothetical protein [Planctomyces sp. SH-PL14]|uniref:hypothetical protein n=1 Tax=Planctomyces sp. SH-PL14 TaxID=1632864 RepID=UPI00078B621D|nr:hypothetical protein [Planctomyces sp. SH-PL14]AMV20448.1 hypothetical protein VT03_21295 [Planctomyces sp. SH-PL14]
MNKIVLSLCDLTTNMVRPWLDAGYECWCVDMQHAPGVSKDGNLVRVGADILEWLPPRREYAIVFAFPPCTHFAVSGARWFKDKGLGGLAQAVNLVERCRDICEWSGAPWMLENPVGTLATYWRKADHMFDPCDYGQFELADNYTKKTCLWTGGGFVMPDRCPIEPTDGSRMHLMPPSADRANLRSATPMGFARAVFEANKGA